MMIEAEVLLTFSDILLRIFFFFSSPTSICTALISQKYSSHLRFFFVVVLLLFSSKEGLCVTSLLCNELHHKHNRAEIMLVLPVVLSSCPPCQAVKGSR